MQDAQYACTRQHGLGAHLGNEVVTLIVRQEVVKPAPSMSAAQGL